ncbi:GNAT family N-acetyltransferase [Streptococcus porcinus]|uniref:Acetyltransferase, GNAT family protein n=1 Tax=Streptococcus porcinus TaxID=1340 RepID=A0A4V0H2E8_STRPO|nr:GNAT family N-acetyltransferase [Streptococcus porcinus]VTT41723.1 Acetyltransferase, GNAT family protein [Streptococcus porcinus]VTT42856.1 Acetyltransferase, GNAT family protein [Streptococcus porcinus]
MSIKLKEVNLQSSQYCINQACELIKKFWKEHSDSVQTDEESMDDFKEWQSKGNFFYLVQFQNQYIGFARLGNRGAKIDWLEDLFIDEKFQNRGLGTQVITILENKVKQYSESLYLEVASRNLKAMKLYRELGFDCLNSVTIRKDFQKENFEVIESQKISDFQFDIKKYNK